MSELELDDIQSGVLRPRPTPYAATYLFLRIDDRLAGRELMRRVSELVPSAAKATSPAGDAWVSVALTYSGLEALGVPRSSLESFPEEFREGMAGRARVLGDVGANSPENWEKPFGSGAVHVVLVALASDRKLLEPQLARARAVLQELRRVEVIWELDCFASADESEHFGFRDGISHPAIEGSNVPGSNPEEAPLKAGEFVLGYPDEMGGVSDVPEPEALGRNGTFVVIRKLHQRVAAFREYLRSNAATPADEELVAAKMMGRWRSGAPLALTPDRDDPELGADPKRRNAFLYYDDDKLGFRTPPGCHIRRMNPRDGLKESGTSPRLRRMIRRGTNYGPPLAREIVEDDGIDRGLMFVFVGAHLRRQFEFVQAEWVNRGDFISASGQTDPITGAGGGTGELTIPRRPVRRRLQNLPAFVVTRGGEYCFMPGLRALRWLAELPE